MTRDRAIEETIRVHLKALKLPGMARVFRDLGRQMRESGWLPEEYLLELLEAEMASRTENVSKQRRQEARFPVEKTLDDFVFDAQPHLDRDLVMRLSRCEWVGRAEPVLFAGPVGTGKTHLAIALGIEATNRRHRVRFHRADDLVRELVEATTGQMLGRIQKRIDRVEVLVVDELGFVPFDRVGAELLFNLLANRYGRRATVVTSNLAFSEWSQVFGDNVKMTAALLDRLAENAHVVTTSGASFRAQRRGLLAPTTPAPEDVTE
jgi:DNA replication protein DnaC